MLPLKKQAKSSIYSPFLHFFCSHKTHSFKAPQYKVQHYGSNHPPVAEGDITQVQSEVAEVNVQLCILLYPEHSSNSVAFRSEWELKRKLQRWFGFKAGGQSCVSDALNRWMTTGKENSSSTGQIDQMPPTRLTSTNCPAALSQVQNSSINVTPVLSQDMRL